MSQSIIKYRKYIDQINIKYILSEILTTISSIGIIINDNYYDLLLIEMIQINNYNE